MMAANFMSCSAIVSVHLVVNIKVTVYDKRRAAYVT